ncbi:glycosyl transferase 2 family protein [Plesiomonas shigelloides]|uniref:glycosyltransferase family 2 protein n=1 Tax=Plesiomonas shigelloides TaxID=703 RepID=UPI000D1261DE|nr:glycosyltransferase [Plesiomonas shigelloides]AVQ87627.1 glycosyl transferase 2 family protein [Plesiomonas shigelloides]
MSSNEIKPLVSIAIITYNQKEFLKECIESCLAQDYPNLEIVVADDGSTDGTHDLLNDYDRKYPGKFVLRLSKENQGITKNSNAAHFACTGKYVAWIGGDDLMLPSKISKQVEFMERNPDCTISYHDMDVFDSDSNETIYIQSKRVKPREGGIKLYIKHGVFNGACSSMVRRSKAPESGYNELLPVASDWCYWVDALYNGGEIKYIPEILSRYRRHSKNVTAIKDKIGQNSLDHLNTCNYIITKYPEYMKEALYCYSKNIRSLRKRLPYMTALLFAIRSSFDFRSLFAVILFIITFGRVKA